MGQHICTSHDVFSRPCWFLENLRLDIDKKYFSAGIPDKSDLSTCASKKVKKLTMHRSQNSSHQIQHIVYHKNSCVHKGCFVRPFHTDLCNCILSYCSTCTGEDEFFHPILNLDIMKVFKHNNSSTGVAIGHFE